MAIVVVNNTDTELSDRYNGVDIIFPVGKKVLIDEETGRHIFGFGDANKAPYLARLGWMRTSGDFDAGMARLAKFSFAPFDPYAQLDEARPADQQEQQLSPVAPEDTADSDSSGPEDVVPSTPPATTSKGILSKLQGMT